MPEFTEENLKQIKKTKKNLYRVVLTSTYTSYQAHEKLF
jgi:hypothetical protein